MILRNLILRASARKMRFRRKKSRKYFLKMGPEGPIGPVVGNPVKKSHFARTCAQNEISLGKNYMDIDGNSCGWI